MTTEQCWQILAVIGTAAGIGVLAVVIGLKVGPLPPRDAPRNRPNTAP